RRQEAPRDSQKFVLSFFFSSRRRHTRFSRDWSSDVCSSDLDPHAAFSASVPYLAQAGLVLSGWQLGRAALAARRLLGHADTDRGFLDAKIATAQFFAEHLLPRAAAQAEAVAAGAASTMAIDEAAF